MFQTKSHAMKKFVPLLMAVAAAYFFVPRADTVPEVLSPESIAPSVQSRDTQYISGAQVTGAGTVERILSDDNDGSRHQRFILRLASGRTVLVAHNIDLAARIGNLEAGDRVEFNGEFVSNEQGGVIHWTHNDPARAHEDGWLRHGGRTYQ